jgi:hypothetical protein
MKTGEPTTSACIDTCKRPPTGSNDFHQAWSIYLGYAHTHESSPGRYHKVTSSAYVRYYTKPWLCVFLYYGSPGLGPPLLTCDMKRCGRSPPIRLSWLTTDNDYSNKQALRKENSPLYSMVDTIRVMALIVGRRSMLPCLIQASRIHTGVASSRSADMPPTRDINTAISH